MLRATALLSGAHRCAGKVQRTVICERAPAPWEVQKGGEGEGVLRLDPTRGTGLGQRRDGRRDQRGNQRLRLDWAGSGFAQQAYSKPRVLFLGGPFTGLALKQHVRTWLLRAPHFP